MYLYIGLLACVCLFIYIYIHIYIYIYMHTYIHTYIHTYTHPLSQCPQGGSRHVATDFQRSPPLASSTHYLHIYTYIYIYIYIYMHIYIYIYIVFPPPRTYSGISKRGFTLLDLCASSFRRGHANLLCIVPI